MLTRLGAPATPEDAVGLLLECHHRIRTFLALARRIAAAGPGDRGDVADSAARVTRYFTQALPLHARDEEESVLPRLRGRAADVDVALEVMAREHREHEGPLGEVSRPARRSAGTRPACRRWPRPSPAPPPPSTRTSWSTSAPRRRSCSRRCAASSRRTRTRRSSASFAPAGERDHPPRMHVRIYVKDGCPYSAGAKRLLDEKGIAYEEVNVTAEPERRAELEARTGGPTTLPQVFFGDRHVGGFADLQEIDRTRGIRTLVVHGDDEQLGA